MTTTNWILKLLDEPTVVWLPPERDGKGDYSSWPSPFQVNGRWQFGIGSHGPKLRYETDGSTRVSRTSVWIDQLIVVGSYLWKGELTSLTSGETPENLSEASQVIAVKNVRSIIAKDYLYKAFLDVT